MLVSGIDFLRGQVFGADGHVRRDEVAGVGQRPFDDAGIGCHGDAGTGLEQQANGTDQANSAQYHASLSQKVQQAGGFEFQDELPDPFFRQADVVGFDFVAQVAPVALKRRDGRAAAAHEGVLRKRALPKAKKQSSDIY